MARIFQSLIQSDFGGDDHHNFEAVVVEGEALQHWWRDNAAPGSPWKRGKLVVAAGVAGPGAIIQSDFGDGDQKNFEVVVPVRTGDGRIELQHFFHDNSDVEREWQPAGRVTRDGDEVAGPAALIQSNFGGGDQGNFELVVPLRLADGRVELHHFFKDNADVANVWQHAGPVTQPGDAVAGPGSLIRSSFGPREHGNFEVLVPLRTPGGKIDLWHYFHDNNDVHSPWQQAGIVATDVSGPAVVIQSSFGSGEHGNFEALVPQGGRLTHYWRDNANLATSWRAGQIVSNSLDGWACLIQSSFGPGEHKNFEALVEEGGGSLIDYFHSNVDPDFPWLRDKPLLPRGYQIRLPDTRKIVQLTGEYDREGWNGAGTPRLAHNRTESRFGIRGTDLGASFVHKEHTYFLFGDTWRVDQSQEDVNLDSIAFTTDTNPDNGLDLTFLARPPIVQPPIGQAEFDVPLDGISDGGAMYVFFSTDHFKVEAGDQMGRSVLARSDDDGETFRYLYDWSTSRFINVSVERLTLDPDDARRIGIDETEVFCIWGSGRYRSSDVYLALLPASRLITGGGRLYYAGAGGAHAWSRREEDATPLFNSGCVGELSARWNAHHGRFLLMHNSDSPRGIVMHMAQKPWGPWTPEPVMVFDPSHREPGLDPDDPCLGDGYGKFMHVAWSTKSCDHAFDDMFGWLRENEWGGEYGPCQIANLARSVPAYEAQLFFTMSTWNPYQVVLMTTAVRAGDVERAYDVDGTIKRLAAANIDFSVSADELRRWLTDSAFTPYPAIAGATLDLLGGRRLRLPAFLDVIVHDYENAPMVTSPRAVGEVRGDLLKSGVLAAYNQRNGCRESNFEALLT